MNTSRTEGCTLTGALSVTTAVRDAISIIHGPSGCSHHNFSLLHALQMENERTWVPHILSTRLSETEIIYGGENALAECIRKGVLQAPAAIFVLTTCIVDTIGDDVDAVCGEDYGVPVTIIPTSGFLGGVFRTGYVNALISLSQFGKPGPTRSAVNLIGEKNLEYEVEENFQEITRLLSLLGVEVNLRFVHGIQFADMQKLGAASLNILREDSVKVVGEELEKNFGTPFIPSFPVGLEGTVEFLEHVALALDLDARAAVAIERKKQASVVESFRDMRGIPIKPRGYQSTKPVQSFLDEIAMILDLTIDTRGVALPIPDPLPVGTAGITRMLHRWRRSCNA